MVVAAVAPRYLVGASLQPDFRRKLPPGDGVRDRILHDDDWNSPGFRERYRELLSSNYLAEIFCRLAHVETDFFRIEVASSPPPFAVPDVLLHMTTTRSAKQWLPEYWRALTELAGAFERARAAVVVDAGPMHIAAAVGCPTICIFDNDVDGDGASPVDLWAPRGPHIFVVRTPTKCQVCVENRFKNEGCLVAGVHVCAICGPSV